MTPPDDWAVVEEALTYWREYLPDAEGNRDDRAVAALPAVTRLRKREGKLRKNEAQLLARVAELLDEIARLRERETAISEANDHGWKEAPRLAKDVDAAGAEVARLEEALREIIADGGSYKRAWMIARRALAHEEEA